MSAANARSFLFQSSSQKRLARSSSRERSRRRHRRSANRGSNNASQRCGGFASQRSRHRQLNAARESRNRAKPERWSLALSWPKVRLYSSPYALRPKMMFLLHLGRCARLSLSHVRHVIKLFLRRGSTSSACLRACICVLVWRRSRIRVCALSLCPSHFLAAGAQSSRNPRRYGACTLRPEHDGLHGGTDRGVALAGGRRATIVCLHTSLSAETCVAQ